MTENHPLTEEQITKYWDEASGGRFARWETRPRKIQDGLSGFARDVYDQGVKDTQERTGWTDDQLTGALEEAAIDRLDIAIEGDGRYPWSASELADLRAILAALGINHEPPVTPPDPKKYPLIFDNTDGSVWRYSAGKYRTLVTGPGKGLRDPDDFTDWSPARVVKADDDIES